MSLFVQTVQTIYEKIKDSLQPLNNPILKGATIGGLALMSAAYANAAALNWSVTSHYDIANYTSALPGDEIMISYLVTNLSELGDANGMIEFTVQGGSNQGVFYGTNSNSADWTCQIFDNETTWSGSTITAGGGDNTFYLYAVYLGDPVQGTVSAVADGGGIPENFGNLSAWTNAPEPTSMALLALGVAALGLKRKEAA